MTTRELEIETDTPETFDGSECYSPNTQSPLSVPVKVTNPSSLRLVNKKIPMRFCEYKISNTPDKMLSGESVSISTQGILFNSPVAYGPGVLVRVWIEMPDYWARKSRHVGYRHTDAPTYFQVLTRVISVEETNKRNQKFQLLCETLNLDTVDEVVLNDYLGVKS